jgi:hypothetical protein
MVLGFATPSFLNASYCFYCTEIKYHIISVEKILVKRHATFSWSIR